MELPSRPKGNQLLPPGEMTDIRRRLRLLASKHDIATVIACAFDHRTRILPFIFADLRMAPGGVRAVGSALVDSGMTKTRIVLQQWNKNFSPQKMRLDGRIPDLFLVSSMHLHGEECDRLIREANAIDEASRPLIIAGGPRIIYEPWHVFSANPDDPWGADVAITGEEYVLLSLLEVLLSIKSPRETMRQTFLRARDSGALDAIPGIVYAQSSSARGPAEELIDTGIQQLLGDLDELPSPVIGYSLLEKPGKSDKLALHALTDKEVRKYSPIGSMVLTSGCKFRCSYCPIPAYNQRQHRVKTGERVAAHMGDIAERYGIQFFFGADDNFFNDTARTMDIADTLARHKKDDPKKFGRLLYATEATVHDSIRMQEHLPKIRESGLIAVWMGVEDLTGTLVKKGQSESKTLEAFKLLRSAGIAPIPMMMHHDTQPLISWGTNYGIINQLGVLRKAGALYTQVLMLTPATGSKWYEETFSSGLAFSTVNGEEIEPYRVDGNYVVASKHARPWMKQLNLLIAYTYFFNPLRMLWAIFFPKSNLPHLADETRPAEEIAKLPWRKRAMRWLKRKAKTQLLDAAIQCVGMAGLFHTYRHTIGWMLKLVTGRIERAAAPPISRLPMRDPAGGPAAHALPGTATQVQSTRTVDLISIEPAPQLLQLSLASGMGAERSAASATQANQPTSASGPAPESAPARRAA